MKLNPVEKDSVLLNLFGPSARIRILSIFFENPYFDFSKEELVRELHMSKKTVYHNINELLKKGMIKKSRNIGRATMYRINRKNEAVRSFEALVDEISMKPAGESTD